MVSQYGGMSDDVVWMSDDVVWVSDVNRACTVCWQLAVGTLSPWPPFDRQISTWTSDPGTIVACSTLYLLAGPAFELQADDTKTQGPVLVQTLAYSGTLGTPTITLSDFAHHHVQPPHVIIHEEHTARRLLLSLS